MKKAILLIIVTVLAVIGCTRTSKYSSGIRSAEDLFLAMENNRQWPSYRGFFADGYMKGASLPDSFNIESGYNVKWEVPIPGMGLSCPSIWDDRIFITTAISEDDGAGFRPGLYGDIAPVADSSRHTWMLYCISRTDGSILWERVLHEGIPSVKRHPKSTHANTTVATDGRYVIVFLGGEGLYCYDMNGKELWTRDFGPIKAAWNVVEWAEWEFCSSPLIFHDKVIIQADALNTAFVEVMDIRTGQTEWRKERDEIPGWCTPNISFDGERALVMLNGYKHRGAYDFETGEEVWEMDGGGDIPIPTPIPWMDLTFFNSAHGRHAPMMAVKNSARGEIPYPESDSVHSEDLAWFYDRGGAYMSSVVVYDSLLYRMRWNGNLVCFDAGSGEMVYDEMVDYTSFIASPVIADGRLWLVSEEGDVYQVPVGREFRVERKLPLGGLSLVTPGVMPDMIVFRTAGKLIGVGS